MAELGTCFFPSCLELGTNQCSGCKTTVYCSATCQKAHWPHHKLSCEGRKPKPGLTIDKAKEEDNNSSSNLDPVPQDVVVTQDPVVITCSAPACSQPGTNKCSGCKTTFYCCADCQRADWPHHKLSCEGRVRKVGTTSDKVKEQDDSSSKNTTTTSTTTSNNSSSSDLGETHDSVITCSAPACSQPGTNKCSGCKTTFYCCADCQRADWPHHKLSCEGRVRKVGMTSDKVKEDNSTTSSSSSSSKNTTTTSNNNSSSDLGVICSASGCSQPGTNKCSGCKSVFYCSAKCQKADWSHHKDTCEGQLRKVGSLHLDKAKGFLQEQNWPQALMCSNITLAKLNLLNDRPVEDIAEALGVKVNALNGLNLVEQDQETLECAKEWHSILTTKHTSAHPSTINAGFSVIERWVCIRILNNQCTLSIYSISFLTIILFQSTLSAY